MSKLICIHCQSKNLTYSESKQGFGVGKAVLGFAFLGPVGALAGFINRNKKNGYAKCGDCSEIFEVQKGIKYLESLSAEELKKKQYIAEAKKTFGTIVLDSTKASVLIFIFALGVSAIYLKLSEALLIAAFSFALMYPFYLILGVLNRSVARSEVKGA